MKSFIPQRKFHPSDYFIRTTEGAYLPGSSADILENFQNVRPCREEINSTELPTSSIRRLQLAATLPPRRDHPEA